MPMVRGDYFEHSVVYIFEHSDQGAAGLIINKPSTTPLSDAFEQLDIDYKPHIGHQPALVGGPVDQTQGFVLHTDDAKWSLTTPTGSGLAISTSLDSLHDLAQGVGAQQSRLVLGYSGWGKGQLEKEIADNAWLVIDVDTDLMFSEAFDKQWLAAGQSIGVDMSLMSRLAGHA